MNNIPPIAALAALIIAGMPATAEETSEAADSEALNCVRLSNIDRTYILDRQNILFYMRGDRIYLNTLPNKCPGLRRNETFSYRTSLNQLCNVDIITVLRNFGGSFSRGASCGLGKFRPVTEEQVAELRERRKSDAEPEERDGDSPDNVNDEE